MKTSPALILVFALAATDAGAQDARRSTTGTSTAISAEDLRARLFAFAHDSMGGRQVGTAGNAKATDHIASEFTRFGLRPGGDDGTYFQTLPYALIQIDTASRLEVNGEPYGGDDFIRIDARAAARPLASTQAVYGGIASDTSTWITADQARGKLVVFGLAAAQRERRAFFQYNALARHPRFAGAAALAFPQLEFIPPFALNNVRRGFPVLGADEDSTLVPQLQISGRLAEALIPSFASASAETAGATVNGAARLLRSAMPYPTRNVVGILPGSDPALRGQYFLMSAHNDHVGRTPNPIDHDSLVAFNTVVRPGGAEDSGKQATESDWPRIRAILDSLRRVRPPRTDSVFNGADDDGSGTVAILEIAEAMAAARNKPRRSIIFVSHTAEEVGLVGSRWFTDHPPVPLDSIVAMIDMDMIGRGTAADIPGGGPAYLQMVGSRRLSREFGDLLEQANASQRAPFTFDYTYDAPGHPLQYYCRADHYSYARYGIPSASVSRGGHRDYHQLSDEAQYISYPDLARVAQLVHDAAVLVGNAPARPKLDGGKPSPGAQCRQ